MNRELKFRVWNGMEIIYDVIVGKFGAFYVNPGNTNGLDPNDSASLTPFNTKYPDTIPLMQYIGLKDKNSNPIYDEDILKDSQGFKWLVSWNHDHACFQCTSDTVTVEVIDNLNMEVIGNRFGNPELLQNGTK